MNIEEKSLGDAIRSVGSRLAQVHTCEDNRGTMGTSHVTWDEGAQALRDISYNSPLVIESFNPKVLSIARASSIWRPLVSSPDVLVGDGLIISRYE